MGNFKHQSLRSTDREQERDRDRDRRDREGERDRGHSDLRNVGLTLVSPVAAALIDTHSCRTSMTVIGSV